MSSLLFTASTASAQFDEFAPPAGKGARPDKPFTQRYQAGVRISAGGSVCRGLYATIPVPVDWPEQTVKIDAEDISRGVNVRYAPLGEGVNQMVVAVPLLPAGQRVQSLVTYEVTRYTLLPPENPDIFVIPKRLKPNERRYLGFSPLIETRHGDIRSKVKEILAEHDDATAWKQVEVIYDWVRDNVGEERGKLKGAVQTLRDGVGNNEDRTSLFIALTRAAGIPARTVWVPDSCYAEFMLADDEGENHWLPCRLGGEREFGGSSCELTILQKGDNFKVPNEREPVRFVPEFLKGAGGRPSVEFVRVPLSGS